MLNNLSLSLKLRGGLQEGSHALPLFPSVGRGPFAVGTPPQEKESIHRGSSPPGEGPEQTRPSTRQIHRCLSPLSCFPFTVYIHLCVFLCVFLGVFECVRVCVTNAVQFQLAHVCELLGQVPQARSKYEVLLGCRTVTSNIKALSQKQLGMCVLVCVYRILRGI